MDDFELELKNDFLEEADALLESAEQAFLKLENDWKNSSLLDEIFRLAHNLKGTSRAVGFGDVAEFTHEMENLILQLKEGKLEVNQEIITILLECSDHIVMMIDGLKEDINSSFDSSKIISQIISILSNQNNEEIPNTSEVSKDEEIELIEEVKETPEDINENKELLLDIDDVKALIEAQEAQESQTDQDVNEHEDLDNNVKDDQITQNEGLKFSNQQKEQAKPVQKQSTKKADPDESIRVSLSKVEMLNNFVGELVILQTVLGQMSTKETSAFMSKSISQLGKLTKEIQEISMGLRMVPVKTTLQKMNRIVRDTSKSLDKKVSLKLIGEETEIDKTVLEFLADPLVHIVRNAVDHGLETNKEREDVGKESVGKICIRAGHEGNNLVIEVIDDGGGIDAQIIKNKAIESGILTGDENLSDDQVIQYIFHPGFSTKEKVTEVSGRGVGMDVVKTNIHKLSGSVTVHTELGVGSRFKILLPLTLAIIDGIILDVADEKIIIPLSQMHEALRPSVEMVTTLTGVGNYLNLRGEVLPMFNLAKSLKRKPKEDKGLQEYTAIIVQNGEEKFAVVVDDIIHQQQVVVKSLGNEIKDQRGFMGTSILGNGKPAFIVDLNELYKEKASKYKYEGTKTTRRSA